METIELIFPTDLDETYVARILSAANSGFEPDDRRALGSSIMDGFAIAGVVLDALSLAAAIWALKVELNEIARKRGKEPQSIRVRRVVESEVHTLPTGEIRSVIKAIEEFSETKAGE